MGVDLTESRLGRSVEMQDQDDITMKERRSGDYGDLEGNESHEPQESAKYRSKDKSKNISRREEKEHRSRDQERSKERDNEIKDFEKDRRDKRKEDREERDKDKVRDKIREKDADREKLREKERDMERKDRVKVKEREREREKGLEKDGEGGRIKERLKEKSRDKDKDKEKEREKGKDKDREKNRDRERDRERDGDRSKDMGEREKWKERNREKEKQSDLEKDMGRERERRARQQKDEIHYKGKDTDNDYLHDKHSTKDRLDNSNDVNDSEIAKHHEKTEVAVAGPGKSSSVLEERISKMREERLKMAPEGASEVLSWVNRSRKLEESRNAEKEKAMQLSRIFEEQDNMNDTESDDETAAQQTTHDLGGVKVLHGLDKVLEGGAVVLTLKDQSILADGDINQEIDMLENVEIGEQKRRDEAYKAATKRTGIYDDKFNDEAGSEKKMLPQYDDPVEDEGVTLDSSGRLTLDAEKKLDELRKRIKGVSATNNAVDLNLTGKVSTDYYTQEEMTKFKKPKKKKSMRKNEKLGITALEAEAISAGLGNGDLGSRKDGKRQNLREEQERLEAERKSSAYEYAYAKAEEASKALRQEQVHTMETEEDNTPAFGDDDDELRKSLERARKIALKKQDEEKSAPQIITKLATSPANALYSDNQNLSTGDQPENKVVFTEMEEFVWGLQLDEEEKKPESEDVFMEEDVPPRNSDQEMKVEDGWTEANETMNDEAPVNEEDKEAEVVPDETIHETAVGKGLAGALKLLKDRGNLKETVEWGGRNMDKKKSKLVGIYDNNGSKEIRIERTDEYGRILTPKEAFRLLSHKFHGKGPGKMKQEKRMRQYQEELKIKQMKNADTPSLSVERMREVQTKQQTPYLVLSGHVKPGQNSDPRSGFATVEKDFAGGITPMLGDKKVDYFLNIKRKPETGDGGSHKKPKT